MIGEKNRYVSILKQKAGELDAVRELEVAIWDKWNQLVELLADEDEDGDEYAEAFKTKCIKAITKSCRRGAMVFLDCDGIDHFSEALLSGLLTTLAQTGFIPLIPVPVATLTTGPNAIAAFKAFIATRDRCVGIRIAFEEITNNIAARVTALIAALECDVSKSHLFIDLEYIPENVAATLALALPVIVSQIPQLAQWRTVTLAGTAYPAILQVPGGGNAMLPRTEWVLWNNVRPAISERVRRLDFGDYTISHPELVEFNPVTMRLSPKIIYAIDDEWIAYKGRIVRTYGWQQTVAMCQQLIQRPEFLGAPYSYGDRYIVGCAQETETPGNSRTWKTVGTNHHITFVANQVANIP